ncbi:MAG: hypothetical protein IT338_01950 [Thermomicrobiales bacterium]|nr:hypothetical protein [Thermomicrobiales bacterium]
MPERRQPVQMLAVLFSAAIVAAPFIAFLVRPAAGLFVMILALGAISFLLREALRATTPEAHRVLRFALAANLSLAVACGVALLWLLFAS